MESSLTACGLRPDARAQDLTLPQFVALQRKLFDAVVTELQLEGVEPAAGEAEGGQGLEQAAARRMEGEGLQIPEPES